MPLHLLGQSRLFATEEGSVCFALEIHPTAFRASSCEAEEDAKRAAELEGKVGSTKAHPQVRAFHLLIWEFRKRPGASCAVSKSWRESRSLEP